MCCDYDATKIVIFSQSPISSVLFVRFLQNLIYLQTSKHTDKKHRNYEEIDDDDCSADYDDDSGSTDSTGHPNQKGSP
jgi:hypothetical protein